MAKARSPVYPAIGLKEAVDRVRLVYEKDYTNRVPRAVIAQHMGYSGLSGKSLGVLSALGKYGLLEGRADETKVSALAVAILAHPPGEPERIEALKQAATAPELFRDLDERSQGGRGSDPALKAWLQTEGFIPAAADAAIRAYRETKQLVEEESRGYAAVNQQAESTVHKGQEQDWGRAADAIGNAPPGMRHESDDAGDTPPGMRKAVFTLVEGDIEVTFPEGLSKESVTDLSDYLEIWLRKMRREAGLPPKANEKQ